MYEHCEPKKMYECIEEECLPMPMYATAYIKFQQLCTLYSPMEGLENGTIFPELNIPYHHQMH